MLSNVREIERNALKLSVHERAMLAEQLIRSLEGEEDAGAEQLWIEEAERRYTEYKAGRIKAKPAELVFKGAYSKFA